MSTRKRRWLCDQGCGEVPREEVVDIGWGDANPTRRVHVLWRGARYHVVERTDDDGNTFKFRCGPITRERRYAK